MRANANRDIRVATRSSMNRAKCLKGGTKCKSAYTFSPRAHRVAVLSPECVFKSAWHSLSTSLLASSVSESLCLEIRLQMQGIVDVYSCEISARVLEHR